jgi:two-component system, NarL family, nitrate/nitrite response regulator NarL
MIRPAQSPRIRLVLADGQRVGLAGLLALFARQSDFVVLQHCSNGRDVLPAVRTHRPDVVLVGRDIPPAGAVQVVRALRAEGGTARVVLLADEPNGDDFETTLWSGLSGVVFRTMDTRLIINHVKDVLAGERRIPRPGHPGDISTRATNGSELGRLTRRQLEVARAAAKGFSNKEIAAQLGLAEGTIKIHLHAVYEKFGLDGRIALCLYLREKGLASGSPGSRPRGN